MPNTVKKILLQKSIEGTIYDIMPKTDATVVQYDDNGTVTTVAAKLATLATDLSNVVTQQDIDDAVEALENKIYGLANGESLVTAFDTLKEISEYLNGHGSVVDGFTTDISGLKAALGVPSNASATPAVVATGLFARIETLESKVAALENVGATKVANSSKNGYIEINDVEAQVYDDSAITTAIGADNTSGTIKGRIKALENVGATKVEASATNGKIKIDGTDTTVYDDTALAGRVTTLENVGATKVEASATNGKIKINGTDTTVYDDSAITTAIGADNTSGTIKGRIKALENVGSTKVESSTTNGNIKINGTETTVYNDTALAGRVTTLEGTVGNANSGLVKDVADLKAVGATKVEASSNNGKIKINGTDTTVYDGSASYINQDATHRFVTDTQIAAWNADTSPVVSTLPSTPDADKIYLVEIQ